MGFYWDLVPISLMYKFHSNNLINNQPQEKEAQNINDGQTELEDDDDYTQLSSSESADSYDESPVSTRRSSLS